MTGSTLPPTPTLPSQVSPPDVALTRQPVHAVAGVDVVALPLLPGDEAGGSPLLGPGAAEVGDALGLDLVAVERRVAAKLAVVRSVEVTRQWPDGVLITIQERDPVALVERGGEFRAVDAEGEVFGSFRRAPSGLPRIETPDSSVITDPEVLREAVTVVAALPREVSVLVDHLDLRSIDQIDLVLRDERLVRWGSAEASDDKADVLLALLQQDARVYDVSVPGQPTTSDLP